MPPDDVIKRVDRGNLYARIAMDLCNQDRPRGLPLGCHVNANIAADVQRRATAVKAVYTVISAI